MDHKEFCFHLNEWKKRTGKKDKDFCKEMGIHPNTLVYWKKGTATPQAENMNKLCVLLDINEVDLSPLSFYTAQDNENKLYYRSQQLQRYAKAKDLDEDFYKKIISKPYFLKEFPFSCLDSRFERLRCPREHAEDADYIEKLDSIPLVKYEFKDDYGNIVMLTERDIDYLVKLQQKSEQMIRDDFCLERNKQGELKNRKVIAFYARNFLEDGKPIEPKKLYDEIMKTDVTQRVITGDIIMERLDEYLKLHNVKHKPFRQIMLESVEEKNPPMSAEEKQAWKEHGMAAGLTEDEMDNILQDQETRRQLTIEFEKAMWKQDQKESDNNG